MEHTANNALPQAKGMDPPPPQPSPPPARSNPPQHLAQGAMEHTANTALPQAKGMDPLPPQPSPPPARLDPPQHLVSPAGGSGGRVSHALAPCTRLTPAATTTAVAPVAAATAAAAAAAASSSSAAGSAGSSGAMAAAPDASLSGSTAARTVAATARPPCSSSSTSESTVATLPSTPPLTSVYAAPSPLLSDDGGSAAGSVAFPSPQSDPAAPVARPTSVSSPGCGISDGFDGFAARNCHGESGQLRMIDERHRSSVKRLRDCDEDGEEDEGQRQGSAQLNCATRRVALPPSPVPVLLPRGKEQSDPCPSENDGDDNKSAAFSDSPRHPGFKRARPTRSDEYTRIIRQMLEEDAPIIRRMIAQTYPPPVHSPPCGLRSRGPLALSPSSPPSHPPKDGPTGALPTETDGSPDNMDGPSDGSWLLTYVPGVDGPPYAPETPADTPPGSPPHALAISTDTPPADNDPASALLTETGGLVNGVNVLPGHPQMLADEPCVDGPPYAPETPTDTPPDSPYYWQGTQTDTPPLLAPIWRMYWRPIMHELPCGNDVNSDEEASAARGSSLKRPREEEVTVEDNIRTEDNPPPHKKQFRQ